MRAPGAAGKRRVLVATLTGLVVASAVANLAAQVSPPTPAYVQRGDAVEARYRDHRTRLQRFYEMLYSRGRETAPDLLPTVETASPRPVPHGYGVLPKLVADLPRPRQPPRARPA